MDKQEREVRNAILREAGFQWRKYEADEEDLDFFGGTPVEWLLHDTTTASAVSFGDVVSVREALERGAARGFPRCQEWMDQHPGPTAADERAAAQERAARRAAEDREAEQASREQQRRDRAEYAEWARERARRQAWEAGALAGLAEVHFHADMGVPLPPRGNHAEWIQHWQPALAERFGSGSNGTVYYQFEIEGQPLYVKKYGNAEIYYLPQAQADQLYRRAWAAKGDGASAWRTPGRRALWVLERRCSGFGCMGDDLARWAWEQIGEAELVAAVRAEAPYQLRESETSSYPRASKTYRIPFVAAMIKGGELHGYGDAQSARLGNIGDPLTDWVAVGDEETAAWPTPH